uniref:C-type lectin domain-containing protein n=1 Tax=Pelodiscus sinensis TaxID=13735 RepID=K7GDV7_PELSI
LSAGGSGCKFCPMDWRLRGDKCYWVSTENKVWSKSRSDCGARGYPPILQEARAGQEFIKNLTQGSAHFWVGLSYPSAEKAWTWVNGSRLDQSRLPVSDPTEENNCGAVNGNQLNSRSCISGFQWICQRE